MHTLIIYRSKKSISFVIRFKEYKNELFHLLLNFLILFSPCVGNSLHCNNIYNIYSCDSRYLIFYGPLAYINVLLYRRDVNVHRIIINIFRTKRLYYEKNSFFRSATNKVNVLGVSLYPRLA